MSFAPASPAVHSLTLSLEKGEILGLIGPNGAGKTTVFNLISGLLPPSEGSIRFKGNEITGLQPNRICKSRLARTFQITKPFGDITGAVVLEGTGAELLANPHMQKAYLGLK